MISKKSSLQYFQECLEQLHNASRWLERSYHQCAAFQLNAQLNEAQFDSLENLSSRFARVTDLLLSKTYRALDLVELMEPGTLIDTINRAVKRDLIESTALARTLKDIRNEIVHEYVVEDLQALQQEVLSHTKILLELVGKVSRYAQQQSLAGSASGT